MGSENNGELILKPSGAEKYRHRYGVKDTLHDLYFNLKRKDSRVSIDFCGSLEVRYDDKLYLIPYVSKGGLKADLEDKKEVVLRDDAGYSATMLFRKIVGGYTGLIRITDVSFDDCSEKHGMLHIEGTVSFLEYEITNEYVKQALSDK